MTFRLFTGLMLAGVLVGGGSAPVPIWMLMEWADAVVVARVAQATVFKERFVLVVDGIPD